MELPYNSRGVMLERDIYIENMKKGIYAVLIIPCILLSKE